MYDNYMIPDTPHTSPEQSSEPISERLRRVIGYDFSNPHLARFIDKNAHTNQVDALERQDFTPDVLRRVADRFRQIETMFTEPVARAAEIAQKQVLRERPGMKWVNLELVVPRAIEIVEEETQDRLDVRGDIWYTSRNKR